LKAAAAEKAREEEAVRAAGEIKEEDAGSGGENKKDTIEGYKQERVVHEDRDHMRYLERADE
jgi:hypothetical protein